MKNQTLSIEQMLLLKKLGVDTSKASMFYVPKLELKGEYCLLNVKPTSIIPFIPAFTFQDIMELLPKYISAKSNCYQLCAVYYDCANYTTIEYILEVDRANVLHREFWGNDKAGYLAGAYDMLCWRAENGYLNNNQTK